MDNIENILKTTQITNEPTTVLLALLFCCVSGYLLKFFYDKYSNYNLSNNKISSILPILTIVTFLIITIIKSSIALSLGLVGALSIVRFRTPIKEPEELLFLFLSIALGIGYGSNQIYITTLIYFFILILLWFYSKNNKNYDYNISIHWKDNKINRKVIEYLKKDNKIKLLKIELNDEVNMILGRIFFKDKSEISLCYNLYKNKLKGCEISIYYEENNF